MKTEAYFYRHCEDDHCDLGTFNYECPHCHKRLVDYDIWWKQWDILDGEEAFFYCDSCGEKLMVFAERHGCFVEMC